MKRVLPLLFGLLALAASAQDRINVTFKVFPPDYEVFVGGDRLPYTPKTDVLRTYQLPAGPVRVSLTSPGSFPVSLSLDVKAGLTVQAKLDPRQGPAAFVAEAATGKLPKAVAFGPDGKRLFVALQGDTSVEVYEVPSLKKLGTFAPTDNPASFSDVALIGTEVWAVARDGRVFQLDPAGLKALKTIALPFSGNASLVALGGKPAVTNWDYGQVATWDSTGKPTVVVSYNGSLRGFAAAGSLAYGVLFDQGRVIVSDTATWKTKASWSTGKAPRPVAVLGDSIYVGDMGNASVLVVNANGSVTKTVAVGSNPHQMAVSSAAGLVAVASRGKNNPDDYQLAGPEFGRVALLDAKGETAATLWGRNQPTGLAFSADGKFLAFTDFLDNNVELYRLTPVR